jgi:hypothetical protein
MKNVDKLLQIVPLKELEDRKRDSKLLKSG